MLLLLYRNAARRRPGDDRYSGATLSNVPTVTAHARLTSPANATQRFGFGATNGITEAPSSRTPISCFNSSTSKASSL